MENMGCSHCNPPWYYDGILDMDDMDKVDGVINSLRDDDWA